MLAVILELIKTHRSTVMVMKSANKVDYLRRNLRIILMCSHPVTPKKFV